MTLRVLVTGSRVWRDADRVGAALADVLATYPTDGVPVLVHGGARGADALADAWWRAQALGEPEVHRADWTRYGRRAGMVRNYDMVRAGATVCVAFPLGESRGTRGCIRLAQRAGIPTIVHEGLRHDGT